jgi:hypothetical protein
MNEERPELEACLALKGAALGMYHCRYCGTMIAAGMDTTVVRQWARFPDRAKKVETADSRSDRNSKQ